MPQNSREPEASSGGSTSEVKALDRLRNMLNVPPASRPPDWVNPLEKIEQLLTCAICLDRYKNPKLLPCQHTFCMEPCLDGLIDIVRRSVRCPECRAEHPLPYDGVKTFQTNYTLMGFLEIHLQATDENASELESYIRRYNMERCKVCDEKAEVDYCPHCEKRICLECKSTHIEMLKRDLGRLMNQVKRVCARITDSSDTLSRGCDSLTVNSENVKEEVRDYIRRYIKELKKREDTLTTEVEAFFNGEMRMLKTVRDNLELEAGNINEACARVEACLKGEREMSDEDLVRYKQMFTDGLDYLRAVNPDVDELTNKKIRFAVTDAHLLPHAIAQFGELQVCTPQYSHKFIQAEQMYLPRFLQLGLESDHYPIKKRNWDVADATTWQQPTSTGSRTQPQKVNTEEDAYSSRYRRRQLLEEQAWNRIKGEQPPTAGRRSPRPASALDETSSGAGSAARSPVNYESSPWARVQRMNETPAAAASGVTATAVSPSPIAAEPTPPMIQSQASSNAANKQRKSSAATAATKPASSELKPAAAATAASGSGRVTSAKQAPGVKGQPVATADTETTTAVAGSSKEERMLDQRVADIRKEYEQRQHEQQQTILQIRQRTKPDVSAAVTASSEEEEEEERGGEAIPVMVYPKPREVAKPLEINTDDNHVQQQQQHHHQQSHQQTMPPVQMRAKKTQSESVPGIDWKKYLIPSPPDNNNNSSARSRRSSTILADVPQPTSLDSARLPERSNSRDSDPDASWLERRRRFVRSKTNPDFSVDNGGGLEPAKSRFGDELSERRRRFGRSDSGNNSQEGVQPEVQYREPDRKSRYRRKAERSHSAYLANQSPQDDPLADYHPPERNTEPQRFEISIPSSDQSAPGARFYRVFTNPKIDYLSKGRCLLKFGCKGNTDGQFNWPRGIAVVPTTDEITVCDSSNHRLQLFDKRGRFLKTVGNYGSARGEFDCLAGVCINKYRQYVITDRYNHRVQIFDSNGRHLREFGAHGQTNGRFNSPWGVVVDQQGFIYVCDKDNHRVQIFQADGNFVGKFGGIGNRGGQFQNPHFIACNRQNQLIVTDSSNHRVQVFDHNGHFLFMFGSEGFHEGQFKYPRGVAVDEQGFIVVADSGNNRIQIFYPDGRFYTTFGCWGSAEGQLKGVEGVAITVDGHIVVSDRENHRIQMF